MWTRRKKPFVNTCVFEKVIKIAPADTKFGETQRKAKKGPFWPTFAPSDPRKSHKNCPIFKNSKPRQVSISQGWSTSFQIFCSLENKRSISDQLKIRFFKVPLTNSLLASRPVTTWLNLYQPKTKQPEISNWKLMSSYLAPSIFNLKFQVVWFFWLVLKNLTRV